MDGKEYGIVKAEYDDKGTLDVIQRRLIKWAMCKYKRFRGHRRRAEEWLYEVKNERAHDVCTLDSQLMMVF